MHKIVNLDDERNKLTITISEKEFEISRIVHSTIAEYGKYVQYSGKYLQEIAKLQNIVDKKGATPEEITKCSSILADRISEYASNKVDMIFSMLEKIVIHNNYKFDKQWWLDNSTIPEMEKFCMACIQKDMPEQGKGKKKETLIN